MKGGKHGGRKMTHEEWVKGGRIGVDPSSVGKSGRSGSAGRKTTTAKKGRSRIRRKTKKS